MITIPDELAKRVLEALAEHHGTLRQAYERYLFDYGTSNYRSLRASREESDALALHNELAALLTPKEAT
jgi:hypothetical protein